ncbi:hypothetical protein H0E87_031582, partial [Populus deltoides]
EASLAHSVGSTALQINRLHPSPSAQAPRGIAPSGQAGLLSEQQEVPDASPSTAKPNDAPSPLSGSYPLAIPLATPLTKVSSTPTFWRQTSPGRKRTKVFLANTIALTSPYDPTPS